MPVNDSQPIDVWELRRIFNEGRYWERALSGEFQMKRRRNSHPSPEKSGEPFCTLSQIIAYYDADNQRIANVHQYLRPDGTIGGSHRPDPKAVVIGDTLYYVEAPPLEEVQDEKADE